MNHPPNRMDVINLFFFLLLKFISCSSLFSAPTERCLLITHFGSTVIPMAQISSIGSFSAGSRSYQEKPAIYWVLWKEEVIIPANVLNCVGCFNIAFTQFTLYNRLSLLVHLHNSLWHQWRWWEQLFVIFLWIFPIIPNKSADYCMGRCRGVWEMQHKEVILQKIFCVAFLLLPTVSHMEAWRIFTSLTDTGGSTSRHYLPCPICLVKSWQKSHKEEKKVLHIPGQGVVRGWGNAKVDVIRPLAGEPDLEPWTIVSVP